MAFVEGNVTNINAYRLSLEEAEQELKQAQAKVDEAKAQLKQKESEVKDDTADDTPVVPTGVDDETNDKKKKTKKQQDKTLGVEEAPEDDGVTPTPAVANPENQKSKQRSQAASFGGGKSFRGQNNSTGKSGAGAF